MASIRSRGRFALPRPFLVPVADYSGLLPRRSELRYWFMVIDPLPGVAQQRGAGIFMRGAPASSVDRMRGGHAVAVSKERRRRNKASPLIERAFFSAAS